MLGGRMTRLSSATLALLFVLQAALFASAARATDNTWDYSVQVTARVEAAPARITLSWLQDSTGTPLSYTVFRRAPGSQNWGAGTTLPGNTTEYVDTRVARSAAYEYRIVKVTPKYSGYGYIQAGIEAPLVDARGKMILVVDRTVAGPLAPELARLEQDLIGDGWTVLRREVSRHDSVTAVKAVIKAAYDTDPQHVKSLFLFGHIPVPYSGKLNPDGHPDHVGAWPADAFYGDMDGVWTDTSVDYTQTLNTDPVDAARMSNHPTDGKFDQVTLPSPVELEIGRVDLANMPGRTEGAPAGSFPSEIELLRNYLNKDHAFRHAQLDIPRRAILGDYFGLRGGESFAASGFRNFAPLVGPENVRNIHREFGDKLGVWIREASASEHLLVYACGAGHYRTIAGIGNTGIYNDGATTEFVQHDVRGVFNLLFGSWLGDWDTEDNMLRAPLVTSRGLVSVWSGRPHWFIHPMALGQTIGSTARLTMNNAGDYQTQINTSQNRIHIALMGDPSLRLHPVKPVTHLRGSQADTGTTLTWSASNDASIVGYHVYRAASPAGPFTRLTTAPVASTQFSDRAVPASTAATYMVRAIKLERSPSGSYFNAAQGAFWTARPLDAAPAIADLRTRPAVESAATAPQTSAPAADSAPSATGRNAKPAPLSSPDAARSTRRAANVSDAALTIASSSASRADHADAASGEASPKGDIQ
jgi:hypothetical protein